MEPDRSSVASVSCKKAIKDEIVDNFYRPESAEDFRSHDVLQKLPCRVQTWLPPQPRILSSLCPAMPNPKP